MDKTFLVTLLTRIILTIVGAKLAELGFTQEEAEQGVGSIAAQIVGWLIMFGVALWAYVQHKVTLHAEPPKKKAGGTTSFGPTVLVMLVMIGLASMITGCTAPGGQPLTTEQKLQLAGRTMETIETSILLAQATKAIDSETANQLLDGGKPLYAAYDALFEKYLKGEPLDFDAAHEAFNAAMKAYLQQLDERGVQVERQPTSGQQGGEVSYGDRPRGIGVGPVGAGDRWLGHRMATAA